MILSLTRSEDFRSPNDQSKLRVFSSLFDLHALFCFNHSVQLNDVEKAQQKLANPVWKFWPGWLRCLHWRAKCLEILGRHLSVKGSHYSESVELHQQMRRAFLVVCALVLMHANTHNCVCYCDFKVMGFQPAVASENLFGQCNEAGFHHFGLSFKNLVFWYSDFEPRPPLFTWCCYFISKETWTCEVKFLKIKMTCCVSPNDQLVFADLKCYKIPHIHECCQQSVNRAFQALGHACLSGFFFLLFIYLFFGEVFSNQACQL